MTKPELHAILDGLLPEVKEYIDRELSKIEKRFEERLAAVIEQRTTATLAEITQRFESEGLAQ